MSFNHVAVPIFGLPELFTPSITGDLTPTSKSGEKLNWVSKFHLITAKLERPTAIKKSANISVGFCIFRLQIGQHLFQSFFFFFFFAFLIYAFEICFIQYNGNLDKNELAHEIMVLIA